MKTAILFADGGSRGNPGPAASGYVVYLLDTSDAMPQVLQQSLKSEPLYEGGWYAGETTNNVAEWQGVIKGLEWITENNLGAERLLIYLDSQLVVKQITGEYRVKQPHLKPLHTQALSLLSGFSDWSIGHVYRKDNSLADAQVNKVLDELQ